MLSPPATPVALRKHVARRCTHDQDRAGAGAAGRGGVDEFSIDDCLKVIVATLGGNVADFDRHSAEVESGCRLCAGNERSAPQRTTKLFVEGRSMPIEPTDRRHSYPALGCQLSCF